jgi:hypothetical protein
MDEGSKSQPLIHGSHHRHYHCRRRVLEPPTSFRL